MTDLFQEFRDIERSFRCGAPLPDYDEFDHFDHLDSELEEADYIDEEHHEPVSDFDDDSADLLMLAEVPFFGSLEGGRIAYQ